MGYIAADLIASLWGKASPSVADIEKFLGSVGMVSEHGTISKVISELKGKSLGELIAVGSRKLASVPSGGGAAVSAAATQAGAAAPADKAVAAAPSAAKEEEKKEESEESDDDMGFGLFD